MFNDYHAKLQVFMSTRSVINWAIISSFDRPPLQNSNLAGKNWEGEVTSSNQDSKNNLATLVCGKWVPERFLQLFFFFTNTIEIRTELVRDKSMPAGRCVVQDCNNGSNPREGISLHNSPSSGSVLSSWKRFVSSQELQPNQLFCFLLRAYHWWLFRQVLSCGSIHETPCTGRNSLSMEEKIENDILSCHCCALT